MHWYKGLRSRILSVSATVISWLFIGACCCLIGSRADASNPKETTSTDAVLESYILRAAKKGSFDYRSNIFINIRVGNESESRFEYISQWYKFYSNLFNFSQIPSKNNISILIGKDVIK